MPDKALSEFLTEQGIAALKARNKDRAFEFLSQAIQNDQENERAWLWLSGAVSDNAERKYCLEWVLALNPHSEAARKGLAALPDTTGSLSPLRQVEPEPPQAAADPPPEPPAPPTPEPPAEPATGQRISFENMLPESAAPAPAAAEPTSFSLPSTSLEPPAASAQTQALPVSTESATATFPALSGTDQNTRMDALRSDDPVAQLWAQQPWLTIWLKPGSTMRKIVAVNPPNVVFVMAILAGINDALNWAFWISLGSGGVVWEALIGALPLGAFSGLSMLYVWGWLLRVVGAWLGGEGSSNDVRLAVAASSLPRVASIIFWPLLFVLLAFASGNVLGSVVLAVLVLGFSGIVTLLSIWSLVIFVPCLAAAHRFSIWESLGTMLIGYFILVSPLLLCGCFFFSLLRQAAEAMM